MYDFKMRSVAFAILSGVLSLPFSDLRPDLDPEFLHAGIISVDESKGSGLWVGYYEKESPNDNAPVLLWLNGGPGCSSAKGLIYELGPKLVTADATLKKNAFGYNTFAGLLVIDQPIGTGLSPLGSDRIRKSVFETTVDLYSIINQFYMQHPELQHRPLVISGESYAGKYIPSLAHFYFQVTHPNQAFETIPGQDVDSNGLPVLPENIDAPHFNIVGQAIGNGFIEPCVQLRSFISTVEALGLIPLSKTKSARRWADRCEDMTHTERDLIEIGELRTQFEKLIVEQYGLPNIFNFNARYKYDHLKNAAEYLNRPEVRNAWGALPAAEHPFVACNDKIEGVMNADLMTSASGILTEVIERSDIATLLFNGALDVKDGPYGHMLWLDDRAVEHNPRIFSLMNAYEDNSDQTLYWEHGIDNKGETAIHIVHNARDGLIGHENNANNEDEVELFDARKGGLFMQSDDGRLTVANILNAGHMVPVEEPRGANALLSWFTREASSAWKKQNVEAKKDGETIYVERM